MATRASAVKEVLGLPAPDALLLEEHDDHFYFDQASPSDGSSSEEDIPGTPVAASTPRSEQDSDEEEDLDGLDLADRSTSSLAELQAAETRSKRCRPREPTTPDELQKRIEEGCPCAAGKNCFTLVSSDVLLSVRKMTEAIDGNHRETYLAGKLDALARRGGAAHAGQVHGGAAQRSRITFEYAVSGVRVCQTVFMYAHSCSRYVLKKVLSHLESGCIVAPDHGSKGAQPWNVFSAEETSDAVQFIHNYADKNGLPQPAAPRGHNGAAPIYLPCFTTKRMVHSLYQTTGGVMSFTSFKRVWLKMCADIKIMKPREDVCATCSNFQSKISRALTEDDRISTTDALRSHVNKAIDARDYYRSCISKSKIAHSEEEADILAYNHLTFDFAQQATIPHHGRQVGALYFRVPRRVQIFGVASEGVPVQYNYLVDENQSIGPDGSKSHGPNAVVSMLHHHLEHNSKPSVSLGLHADNCCGQNKNKTVLAYLAWRVLVGLNQEIQLDFMRVGHTRCFVDAGFGLLKQKYRRGDIDTVAQLAQVIKDSASINRAEEFCWLWRSWDSFMRNLFRPVKNITSFQRFSFLSSQPGVVVMSQSDTYQDRHFKILTADPSALQADILPPVVMPTGLSAERAQYLFKEIRPFCHSESQDITCPAPASISDPVVEHDPEEE